MRSHTVYPKGTTLLRAIVVLAVSVLALATSDAAEKTSRSGGAERGEADAVEEEMSALVKLGPGIHRIKKDKKGRVQTLIVVGQARISTVLGVAKGKEMARKKAAQSAKAEFVKWLTDKVEVRENTEEEDTLFLVGTEDNDKDALSEAGKSLDKRGDSYKAVAEGLVRGLTLLHADMNGDEKECTLVYGWSAANAKAAKHTATNDPGIDDKPSVAKDRSSGDKGTTAAKKIRSTKATAKEAEDFLK
jgi:hypothetical protein